METNQPQKRPVGMTVLLVVSCVIAAYWIFTSFVLFVSAPIMTEIIESGELEKFMAPYSLVFDKEQTQELMTMVNQIAQIPPIYWLFQLILYSGSLVGIIKMFKCNKIGFHIFSITQICLLINSSVYFYPLLESSQFMYDLLLAAMFILLYYLYFKRMDMQNNMTNPNQE